MAEADRFWDPVNNVIYDWDDGFKCYVAYNPIFVNANDPFYYMYEEEECGAVVTPSKAQTMGSINSPQSPAVTESDMSSVSSNVLKLLEPTIARKQLPKLAVTPPRRSPIDLPDETEQISPAKPTVKELQKVLETELLNAVNQGAQGRRSFTRRLTQKLATLGGKQMSVKQQVELLAAMKEKAGDVDIDADALSPKVENEPEVKRKAVLVKKSSSPGVAFKV